MTTSRLPVVADLAPVPFTPGLTLATTTAPALIDPNVKTVVPIPVHPVDCAAVTRKTIARWIAHKLNEPAMATQTDLAGAFKDGTLLARLLNVLTGETIEVIPDPVKVNPHCTLHLSTYRAEWNLLRRIKMRCPTFARASSS